MVAKVEPSAGQELRGHTGSANSKKKSSVVPLVCILAGLLIMLYPVVATVQANMQQSQQARSYSTQASQFSQEELDQEVAAAQRWNEEHQGAPILDPWLARITEDNAEYRGYLSQLNVTSAMGRVIIPSIQSDLPIYHGTTEEVLSKGIGHLYGTSLPVGGLGTHTVLTGHTGLSEATLWDNLTDMVRGDEIFLDVAGQKLKYRVSDIEVVLPHETDSLQQHSGVDELTLITCTPYAVNSHRLLVHAERVAFDPADSEVFSSVHMPWQWWMTAVLIIVAFVVGVLLFLWWKKWRKRNVKEPVATSGSDMQPAH